MSCGGSNGSKALLAALLLTMSCPIPATPKVQVDVRPTSVSLGQPISIRASIPREGITTATFLLSWPDGSTAKQDQSSGDWSTWTLLREQMSSDEDSGFLSKEWVVVPFVGGELSGPVIKARYRTTEQALGSLSSQVTTISVGLTREATDNDLRAVRPPVVVPLPKWFWATVGSVVLLGTALVTWLAWAWLLAAKARRNPPATVEQILERNLKELRSRELPKAKRYREFFTRLTDLLRQYLEDRWQIPAPDLTTRELHYWILDQLQDVPVEPATELLRILEEADEVKFAKGLVTAEICSRAIDRSVILARTFQAELQRRAEVQLAAKKSQLPSPSPAASPTPEGQPAKKIAGGAPGVHS